MCIVASKNAFQLENILEKQTKQKVGKEWKKKRTNNKIANTEIKDRYICKTVNSLNSEFCLTLL